MRSSSILAALATASSTFASPLEARGSHETPPGGDTDILNYALTLEYLERAFYREGLQTYCKEDFIHEGFSGEFYDNLEVIAYDEKVHVSYLAAALGSNAVKEATYSFPYTDPKSFVALASILEGVGVAAYLGAANEIASSSILLIAGSVLTVEARHSAYIRDALHQRPFPKPFDTPLDFNAVYSLAAQFITAFAPGSPTLPFRAFPPLSVAPHDGPYTAGYSSVCFTYAYDNAKQAGLVHDDTKVYAVFFSGLDTYYVPVECEGGDYTVEYIPGFDYAEKSQLAPAGQVYVVLSTADGKVTTVSDDNIISGVGVLEVQDY